jgi:hypothetical protein
MVMVMVVVSFPEVLRHLKQYGRHGRVNRCTIRQEERGKFQKMFRNEGGGIKTELTEKNYKSVV